MRDMGLNLSQFWASSLCSPEIVVSKHHVIFSVKSMAIKNKLFKCQNFFTRCPGSKLFVNLGYSRVTGNTDMGLANTVFSANYKYKCFRS